MIPNKKNFPISIRAMELADIERVVEIDHNSFSLPWPKNSFLYELKQNANSRAWVVEVDREAGDKIIIAFIVAWMIVDELHIATIAVDAAFRQHQIAQRLMVHTLCLAAAEGAQKSFLEVRRHNLAAIKMYTKLGYQEDGVRPRYYQDNHEDAILMSLQFINPEALKSLG